MVKEMQTMPRMIPTPNNTMKVKPSTMEFTVAKATSIRAALPASPWREMFDVCRLSNSDYAYPTSASLG